MSKGTKGFLFGCVVGAVAYHVMNNAKPTSKS